MELLYSSEMEVLGLADPTTHYQTPELKRFVLNHYISQNLGLSKWPKVYLIANLGYFQFHHPYSKAIGELSWSTKLRLSGHHGLVWMRRSVSWAKKKRCVSTSDLPTSKESSKTCRIQSLARNCLRPFCYYLLVWTWAMKFRWHDADCSLPLMFMLKISARSTFFKLYSRNPCY